jgi:hypothetical protein
MTSAYFARILRELAVRERLVASGPHRVVH